MLEIKINLLLVFKVSSKYIKIIITYLLFRS